jgi:hypothetical protein
MKADTFYQIITVLITLILGIAVAYNIPAPFTLEDKLPGWLFWIIGFILFLRSTATSGIPYSTESDPLDFIRSKIGMSEDE